jgi:hypothetical protein
MLKRKTIIIKLGNVRLDLPVLFHFMTCGVGRHNNYGCLTITMVPYGTRVFMKKKIIIKNYNKYNVLPCFIYMNNFKNKFIFFYFSFFIT